MEPKTQEENQVAMETTSEQDVTTAEVKIDEGKLERYLEELRLEQNLLFGSLSGALAAIVGAGIWAAITIATNYQIGWMAVAIGFLVGFSMRIAGKGMDKIFGFIGAVLSLIGCLLGNVFTIVSYVATQEGLSFMQTLSQIDWSLVPSLLVETGSPIDLLFYGIAIYEGYKFSFRKITEEELVANATIKN